LGLAKRMMRRSKTGCQMGIPLAVFFQAYSC